MCVGDVIRSVRTRQAATVFLMVLLMMGTGCVSSSIRFTRNKKTSMLQHKTTVSPAWDYRKSYTVPCKRLTGSAKSYLGVKYRYGGMSRSGTDCSGLVCMVYRDVAKVTLPHSSRRQRKLSRRISLRDARCGDLVFFRTGIFGRINHVGIYIGQNKFIHASTRRGVMYNRLDQDYYKKRFAEVRRVFR